MNYNKDYMTDKIFNFYDRFDKTGLFIQRIEVSSFGE